MTELLLSGHNTQETTGLARPATATMTEKGLDAQFDFVLEQLGGDLSRFDRTVKATQSVQGRLYLNMEYFARTISKVVPFDTSSIGVPPEMVKNLSRPSLGQQMVLLPRLRNVYRWATHFYRHTLPGVDHDLHRLYWQLRTGADLAPAWALFEPGLYKRSRGTDRAHVVISLIVVSVDTILRQRVPGLLGLFAGQSTATSQIGRHIWTLRETAEACGEQVCQMLRDGVLDLERYRARPEAAPLVAGIENFLIVYGHRGFRHEADFETERLADHPEHILLAIGGQLAESESPDARAEAARQIALDNLNRMNPLSRAVWRRVLRWGQQLIAWREASKSNLALRQAAYGLAARRLARYFFPDESDDILMFYSMDEFLAFVLARGEKRVKRETLDARRAQYELYSSQLPPPELIWYDQDTGRWTPVQERERAALKPFVTHREGIPASAGSGPAEGIAIVTNDPLDAGQRLLRLRGPVVLVTRLTDPAWSSLFRRLSAVVTELGGVISHAAIVARENGLPAVVGLPEATRWVRDGQRLRVDGATGAVDIVDT